MKSLPFYIRTLLFLSLSISYISCTKEYSVENVTIAGISGGTAVYVISGSNGNCASPVINGTYTKSTAMQSDNTILLEVNVTTIGTYVVVTNIANGVQFTTGGNFTTTGLQTIKLIANGIPLAPGVFQYNPPVGVGCSFLITFS
ncbi:MAG TPA: hypothetical protein VIJ92_06340 [Ginsengibacter sp.]